MTNTARASVPDPDQSASARSQGPTSTAADPTGVTPEIATVIDAAASAFLGRKVRVVSIKLASESLNQSRSWVDHGLTLIHGSHNLVQRGR